MWVAPDSPSPQPLAGERPRTSAQPVAPWPPAGPFPPRMGNTGQHPIVQPRPAPGMPPAQRRPMPGEPLPPAAQRPTGQFPVAPPPAGQFPAGSHPTAQLPFVPQQAAIGSHPTGQFPVVPQPAVQRPTGQFPVVPPQTGQFPAGSHPSGQFPLVPQQQRPQESGAFPGFAPVARPPAGPHLGVPSQAGPQMFPPQAGGYPQAYTGHPYRPEAPRRGKLTGLRVALLVALALVLVTPPAAIAFETVRRERAAGSAQDVDTAGKGPGEANGRPGASGTPTTSPPASVDGKIKQALTDQGNALLNGDAPGFVAAVDPSATALRDELTRRFNSLRQLQVKLWEPSVLDKVEVAGDNTADVIVYVRYCYVVTTCDPMNLETKTKWNVTAAGVKLLEFGTAEDLGPRPFERSELRVAVGKRVIMATTPKYASRLNTMLNAAEKAAELSDRYSKWAAPPSRYVVYLAGPEEWSTWYGLKQESWVAGFALPLTADATEIVLNANRVDVKETLDVLRHEFTHVVTLSKVSRAYDQTWWLVEGIAEYVRVQGLGGRFDDVASVRKYVQSGRWQNEIAMDDPPEGATSADVSGRYGVAYMAVNRMVERFGEAKMLEFFDLTARQGVALQDAATRVYGVSWDDVATDCVKYVRNHV
ncbi:basic secretory protein-like protein [Dactylosporangium sp. NPDC000521]|uniref:basic secretory protein-like protein n=1 Tax=Dactylosporangium sp. NPDC000521 TaxID=3363975 RepID=UPI0036C6A927